MTKGKKGIKVVYEGNTYESVKEACDALGIKPGSYYQWADKRKEQEGVDSSFEAYMEYQESGYRNQARPMWYKGVKYPSANQACKEAGIPNSQVLIWFANNEDAIRGEEMHLDDYVDYVKKKKVNYKGKELKISNLLKELGITYATYKKWVAKGNDIHEDGVESLIEYHKNIVNKHTVTVFGKKYKSTLKYFEIEGLGSSIYRSYLQWVKRNGNDEHDNPIEYYVTFVLGNVGGKKKIEYDGKTYNSMEDLLKDYKYTFNNYYAWKKKRALNNSIEDFLDYKLGKGKDKVN